jgi:hypothetical protein
VLRVLHVPQLYKVKVVGLPFLASNAHKINRDQPTTHNPKEKKSRIKKKMAKQSGSKPPAQSSSSGPSKVSGVVLEE